MKLKVLTEADAREFWDLRLAALLDSPLSFGASYDEEKNVKLKDVRNKFKKVYVPPEENFVTGAFDDDGNLIGMVGFAREKRRKLRHKATIWGMYVDPEYRRKGIGKELILEALKKGRKLDGLEQVNLCVVSSNTDAKGLYSTLGFKVYGTEKNALKLDNKYYDEDLMVKFLNDNN